MGRKDANAWGLYDMLGNVYEWCHDWYQEDLGSDDVTDPWGVGRGVNRVIRGGSWHNDAKASRAARRGSSLPHLRNSHLGFRPVRSLP